MSEHRVSLRVNDETVTHWNNYSIEQDLLEPNTSFRVELPGATKDEYDLCAPDADVQVIVDDTILLTGFIDERTGHVGRDGGRTLSIAGRNTAGRLVDESMPLGTIHGLKIKPFVERCIQPWFASVTFDNAANRRSLRGQGANLAKVVREPASSKFDAQDKASLNATIQKGRAPGATAADVAAAVAAQTSFHVFFGGSTSDTKITPGQSRWQVLRAFLEGTGLLAWATADGRQFFVGNPNYDQSAQYRFFVGSAGTDRARETNVTDFQVVDSIGDRYSRVTCVGTGKGDDQNFAEHIKFRSQVSNGPGPDGIGGDFQHRKILIISESNIRNQADCDERARREMGERDAQGRAFVLTVRGHGQADSTGGFALYAPDTMAHVECEDFGVDELCLITRVAMQHGRENAETTQLHLVPKGAQLKT